MKPILEVHNLSKVYRIDHKSRGYLSLRERVQNALRFESTEREDFWALDDVSFSIEAGESIGIIGRNGAGKSTLLKILSKITHPTKGKIITRGRIASLLEVGTGFHPELTGRENIFFNGSLLGMKRREIEKKFDEIVDFSGTDKFLDTPLKHYSSGMQLRLAFSVAAFLEPEILIIDEVLAVGDAEFQKKCLRKMEDVSDSGRTILFVSHNMQAITSLCKKGVLLSKGQVVVADEMSKVAREYLSQEEVILSGQQLQRELLKIKDDKDFKLLNIAVSQDGKEIFGHAVNGSALEIRVDYELRKSLGPFRVFLDILDQYGTLVMRSFHDEDAAMARSVYPAGKYTSSMVIPADFLAPITYNFKLQFCLYNERMLEPTDGMSFRLDIQQRGSYNKTYYGQYTGGLLCPVFNWEIKKLD